MEKKGKIQNDMGRKRRGMGGGSRRGGCRGTEGGGGSKVNFSIAIM